MGTVHLRGPGGVALAYDLPLHETIERQWTDGTLQRVEEDGSPFRGDDQYNVLSGGGGEEAVTAEPGDDGLDGPVRPAQNAPKKDWVAYAVALGLLDEAAANAKTKAELVEDTTPPELTPPDPGE